MIIDDDRFAFYDVTDSKVLHNAFDQQLPTTPDPKNTSNLAIHIKLERLYIYTTMNILPS